MKKMVYLFTVLFLAVFVTAARAERPPRAHVDRNRDGVVDSRERKMERAEVNTAWEKRADTDKDGVVERSEVANAWKYNKARVSNPIEAKYDLNGDGWLEPSEVRELLKDKHRLVETNGRAKVDTALEAKYDANGDGIIDVEEAKALKADL